MLSINFPELYHVATILNTTCASEASVERSFSRMKDVLGLHRWRLGQENTEAELIVSFNKKRAREETVEVDGEQKKNDIGESAWCPTHAECESLLKVHHRFKSLFEYLRMGSRIPQCLTLFDNKKFVNKAIMTQRGGIRHLDAVLEESV